MQDWDTDPVEYSGAGVQTDTASSKGAYVTTSKSGGKQGPKLKCRTHNTNEHKWNDEVCKVLRASEPATGTADSKNQPNQSKKGSSDGSKKGGYGKGSGKACWLSAKQEPSQIVNSVCVRGDICDNFEDFEENTKSGQEFVVFDSTVYKGENAFWKKCRSA